MGAGMFDIEYVHNLARENDRLEELVEKQQNEIVQLKAMQAQYKRLYEAEIEIAKEWKARFWTEAQERMRDANRHELEIAKLSNDADEAIQTWLDWCSNPPGKSEV